MKKYFFIALLTIAVGKVFSQGARINYIRVHSETVDSIEFIVHYSFGSCGYITDEVIISETGTGILLAEIYGTFEADLHIIDTDTIIGTCALGNFDTDTFKIEKKDSNKELRVHLMWRYKGIVWGGTNEAVYGEYHLVAESFYDFLWSNTKQLFTNNKIYFDAAKQVIVIDETFQNQSFKLELIDLQGNIVLQEMTANNFVNVKDLPNGIYLCRILHDGQVIYSDKILKRYGI